MIADATAIKDAAIAGNASHTAAMEIVMAMKTATHAIWTAAAVIQRTVRPEIQEQIQEDALHYAAMV